VVECGLCALSCCWVVDWRMHLFHLCKCDKASLRMRPCPPLFTESQHTFTHTLAGKCSKMCIFVNMYDVNVFWDCSNIKIKYS
jgi:hypothetical protein